jgi:hypothetical protein
MKQSYSVALIAAFLRVFSEMFGQVMLDLGGESEDGDLLIVKWGNIRAGNLLSLNGPQITAANIQGSLQLASDYIHNKSQPGTIWLFEETFTSEAWSSIPDAATATGFIDAGLVATMTVEQSALCDDSSLVNLSMSDMEF